MPAWLENKVKKAIRKKTKHFLGSWGCAQKKRKKKNHMFYHTKRTSRMQTKTHTE